MSGHLVLAAACGAVLLAAITLTPGVEHVSLFGTDIPSLCAFRQWTGWRCPGCGLTRSFVFLAHGHLIEGVRAHWFGPLLFTLVAAQVPVQLVAAARARRAR